MTLFRVTLTPPRFLALISPHASPSSDERALRMGVPTTVEGEDFRQPHWSEPEPIPPSSPWMVEFGIFCHPTWGPLGGSAKKGGAAYKGRIIRASGPGKSRRYDALCV